MSESLKVDTAEDILPHDEILNYINYYKTGQRIGGVERYKIHQVNATIKYLVEMNKKKINLFGESADVISGVLALLGKDLETLVQIHISQEIALMNIPYQGG